MPEEAATLPLATTLERLPPIWPEDPMPAIRAALRSSCRKVVILDDDPTGTQTVHDVAVVTDWTVETLRAELEADTTGFYILTNSRGLQSAASAALHEELAANLKQAAAAAQVDISVISRSDSTLRGHFPLETDILSAGLGPYDGVLLVPYFQAGGRLTIGSVHYVAVGDELVPAAETQFARDASFGYRHSDLRLWVEEKTRGRIRASDVSTVTLSEIRRGPEEVRSVLLGLAQGSVCVCDAVTSRDVEVLALAVMQAESAGRRFLFRSAASFVAARLGLASRPLLAAADFAASPHAVGGLVVVGSYVPLTTAQLRRLRSAQPHQDVELSVPVILDPDRRKTAVSEAITRINLHLERGELVILYTSRELITGSTPEESLAIVRKVSSALVEVVQGLTVRPRFLIAKGGITSSDVATAGLGVRRATVQGQLLPGVPVWRLGAESRFPGLNYVIFPGNVGGESALADAVKRLQAPLTS